MTGIAANFVNTHRASISNGGTMVVPAGIAGPPGPNTVPTDVALLAANRRLETTSLYVYGSSFTTDPGQHCTSGAEFFKLVKSRLNMLAVTTFGVSGTSIRKTVRRLVGGESVANAAWTAGRKGIAIIDTYVNDLAAPALIGGHVTPQAYTPLVTAGIKGNLRASLAAISAATRIEQSAGTEVGAWSTGTQDIYSGATNRSTSTPGDNITFTGVTFPASGCIYLGVVAFDPAVATSGAIDVYIDGVKTQTIPAADLQQSQVMDSLSNDSYSPVAFKVTAAPGSHTVKIQHAGTAGQYLFMDCLYIPAPQSAAPLVLLCVDQMPVVGVYTSGDIATMVANKSQLDAIYAAVIADFPNVVLVPTTLVAATDYYSGDGIHPNDRGMVKKADECVAAIRSYLAATNTDAFYPVL